MDSKSAVLVLITDYVSAGCLRASLRLHLLQNLLGHRRTQSQNEMEKLEGSPLIR